MAKQLVHANCGKPGADFIGAYDWVPGTVPVYRDFRHLDGQPYVLDEILRCDSCGQPVMLANWNGEVVLLDWARV